MTETKLTADRVRELMGRALFKDDERDPAGIVPQDAVLVEGVTRTFGFHPGRLAEIKPDVDALLAELPEQFQGGKGGGWSFLNACMDRNDHQWGEHQDIEALVCLGIGAGSAAFLMPRDMWDVLPGGMPYFVVHPTA